MPSGGTYSTIFNDVFNNTYGRPAREESSSCADIDYELVVAPTLSALVEKTKEKLKERIWCVTGSPTFIGGQFVQALARDL